MKTFFNILQTLIDVQTKTYPDELFNDCTTCFDLKNEEHIHVLFLINKAYHIFLLSKPKSHLNKIAFAKFMSLNSVLINSFYKNELKEKIFTIFSIAQKHYHSFIKFAHICKLKKNPYVVTDDLSLSPLDRNNKLTFTLIESRSNYLFNINELIQIIETAIGNSPNFFSQPLSPQNPYNKQKLTLATLYNIYFQIKDAGRIIPLLFHLFFLENFNKDNFLKQYEIVIRENAIKKYVFNSPHTLLYYSVLSMLSSNIYTQRLIIHKEFPKDLLVNIFRPYLFYFYIINYLEDSNKCYTAKKILQNKLKRFYEYNKLFGRKTFKLKKFNNTVRITESLMNTNHITFYDIECNVNNSIFVSNIYSNIGSNRNSNRHSNNRDGDNNRDNSDSEYNNEYETDYEDVNDDGSV